MAAEIKVVKGDGQTEPFDPEKVKRALKRSGISDEEASRVITELRPSLHDGISTSRIYSLVYQILRKEQPEKSHRYNLKRALQLLGPAGYEFEDFVAALFSALGYGVQVRQNPRGRCISHEIDVEATKGNEVLMVECKFRNEPGTRCKVQTALYVYARFLDLQEGSKQGKCAPFTAPCLVTNAKFSEDVSDYAKCMGMRLIGWDYPRHEGIERLIDSTKCYPITIIPMNSLTLQTLLKHKIITVKDVPENAQALADLTGISLSIAQKVVKFAEYAKK